MRETCVMLTHNKTLKHSMSAHFMLDSIDGKTPENIILWSRSHSRRKKPFNLHSLQSLLFGAGYAHFALKVEPLGQNM